MNIWLTMILAGVITYAIRLSFILLFERLEFPLVVMKALRFVPPAVLTAIIIPELVMHQGALDISLTNARLLAGLLAALIAWRTRNILLTIVTGMAALYLIQYLF